MVLAGIGEFIIGNSFPSLVFFTFGVFWLSLGFFLDPAFGIAMTLGDSFAVPFGFYLITWGVYTFILTIGEYDLRFSRPSQTQVRAQVCLY